MNKAVLEMVKKIKNLEIQGAWHVAVSALEALKKVEKTEEIRPGIKMLARSRPTEPMLRNGLKYIASRMKKLDIEVLRKSADEYISLCENALKKIAEIGSKRIEDKSKIMVFCHSSTVLAVLKKAWDKGKKFEVYACETRPLFQGRLTAKELAAYNIPVTLIVDSSVRYFVNDMDLVLLGADVITADGYVVNKIGTSVIALCAHEARTRCGFASELLKFDPMTTSGEVEPIEERSGKEVWEKKPGKIRIRNPAFDLTPPEYVNFLVTEAGIITPYNVMSNVNDRYPWVMR